MKPSELLHKRGQIVDEMRGMIATADKENRDFTAEENERYNKLDADQNELKNRADRLQRQDNLDKEAGQIIDTASRIALAGGDKKSAFASDEYRGGFNNYLRVGKNGLDHTFLNALQVGTDSEGGYITPEEFETMLVEALQDHNEFRNWVNVITTGSDRNIPVENTLGAAAWTAEEAAYNESDAAFGQVVLGAHKLTSIIKVSEELLQDAFFNVEAYLARNFGKRFANAEEAAIVNGDGSGKPTGLTDSASAGVTAAATGTITADEIIDLYHSLKRPYRRNATFTMHDDSVKVIRKLKDSDNQYLWQPGLQAGQPDMLLGRPVITSDAAETMAASAVPVLFGDLSYYTLAERSGRTMQRLNELYAANGQIGFRMHARMDGKLTLTEAVKKLTMAAA